MRLNARPSAEVVISAAVLVDFGGTSGVPGGGGGVVSRGRRHRFLPREGCCLYGLFRSAKVRCDIWTPTQREVSEVSVARFVGEATRPVMRQRDGPIIALAACRH